MSKAAVLLVVSSWFAAGSAWADQLDGAEALTPIGWYLAPMITHTRADSDRLSDDGRGALLAIGHRGEHAMLELEGLYTRFGSDGATLSGAELVLLMAAPFEQPWLARFHGVLGIGLLRERNIPALADKSENSAIFEAGVAYLQPLRLFGYGFEARAEARYRYDYLAPPHNSSPGDFTEPVFALGFQFPFAAAAAAPSPVPAEELKVVAPAPLPVVARPEPAIQPKPVAAPAEPVTLETAKAGDVVVLSGVNFETAKATLTANARTILDGVAKKLLARSGLNVEIGGHTDSRGGDAYNQKLSEQRANSVLTYLSEQGVAADRMSAVGYGEDLPVDSNDTTGGRERNRRVEMKVLN